MKQKKIFRKRPKCRCPFCGFINVVGDVKILTCDHFKNVMRSRSVKEYRHLSGWVFTFESVV